jgi:hypothetical protein
MGEEDESTKRIERQRKVEGEIEKNGGGKVGVRV